MKKPLFTGSGVALVTPMHKDGSINYEAFRKLVEFQISGGTKALIVFGTTGESSTLSDMEKLKLLETAVEAADGRIPVIAGTGSNDTHHAVTLSRSAQRLGADGLLIVTPYYNKCSTEGLKRHYFSIADAVDIPVIAYNVPSRTGVSMTLPVYQALSAHPNMNGVKEASGSTELVLSTVASCGDEFYVWSGNDSQIVPLMALGAMGVISVLANICPAETEKMAEACLAGEFDSASRLQRRYVPLITALFSDVNPIPVKTAMNLMGMEAGPLRLPLCEPGSEPAERLKEILRSLNLLTATE